MKYKGENFWRQEFLTCCWNSSSMSRAVPPLISILLPVFLSMFDYYYDVPAARFTGQVLFALPQWLVCVNLPFPLSHIHSFTPMYIGQLSPLSSSTGPPVLLLRCWAGLATVPSKKGHFIIFNHIYSCTNHNNVKWVNKIGAKLRATYVVQRQTYRHGPAPIYSILVSSNTLSVSFLLKWMLLSSRQCQSYCSADRIFSRHFRHICTCGQPTRANHGPTTVSHWSHVSRKISVCTVICLNTENSRSCALPNPVAEFIDPWLGDKVNSGMGLSYRHSKLHGWWAGTRNLCRSWLYSPVTDLWIRLQPFSESFTPPLLFSSQCCVSTPQSKDDACLSQRKHLI